MTLKSTVVLLTIACIALTPLSCLAQHRQAQDRRETEKKNHPEPCDRFETKRFRNLETKFTEKEKRWFIDFNCPVG